MKTQTQGINTKNSILHIDQFAGIGFRTTTACSFLNPFDYYAKEFSFSKFCYFDILNNKIYFCERNMASN